MDINTLIWLIPLPPILAFFLIVLWARKSNKLSHGLAIGGLLLTWGGAMAVFWKAITTEHLGDHPFRAAIDWLPTAGEPLRFGVLVDPLSAITLFFVAWTLLAIFIYSVG